MAVGWFVFEYTRDLSSSIPRRYCSIYDHVDLIAEDSPGKWSVREIEILGDRALCKVRGLPGNLTTLATRPGFLVRWPNVTQAQMDDPLNSYLTPQQRNRIENSMLDAGYPQTEIDERWTNFNQATYRECLRFMSRRRRQWRFDTALDQFFTDGIILPAAGDPDQVDIDIEDI